MRVALCESTERRKTMYKPKCVNRAVLVLGLTAALSTGAAVSYAQVAGSQTIGISQEEMKLVATGWSAKNNILGKAVYNDKNERIGSVDDLIISPDKSVSFAIIGAGGFLGIGKHDVAIPVNKIKEQDNKLVLPGATKEALKSLPEFQYANKGKKNDRG
jgi:sporulation protein YlmC with PRC-barrel domain